MYSLIHALAHKHTHTRVCIFVCGVLRVCVVPVVCCALCLLCVVHCACCVLCIVPVVCCALCLMCVLYLVHVCVCCVRVCARCMYKDIPSSVLWSWWIHLSGKDETMLAVAIGNVAHLVYMMAKFMELPLRYPIRSMGSKSSVADLVTDKLTDKERE